MKKNMKKGGTPSDILYELFPIFENVHLLDRISGSRRGRKAGQKRKADGSSDMSSEEEQDQDVEART